VQFEELGQLKNPMTSSGIEPATLVVAKLVEALCYKPEVAGSISDEVIGFFN
jgi:hypothetical protein